MIVAVDKVDLFATDGEIADAERYYSPGTGNAFGGIIAELTSQVGSMHFRWNDSIPVCGWLEDLAGPFAEPVKSRLTNEDRDAYLWQFVSALASYGKS